MDGVAATRYIPTTLALRKLYEATGGSTWTYNANWLSGDPCGSSENGNTPWQVANNLQLAAQMASLRRFISMTIVCKEHCRLK